MKEKQWRSCRFMINGLAHKVQYNEATIQELFLPFLRHMSRKQKEAGRRLIILLAAPPGTGKSTLCLLLEKLSQSVEGLVSLQALGLDGFHHTSAYLRSHKIERDGSMIPMSAIKGAPETFNLEHLKERLAQVRSENIRWPVYDRSIHDVIEDVITVRQDIVLLEGNWLLLGSGGWQELRAYADYTVFIEAREEDLKERLVSRKVQGGKTRQEAEAFYRQSDKVNVARVLNDSWPADESWQMLPDGDYRLLKRTPKVKMVDREALWKKPDVSLGNSPLLNSLARRMSQLTPQEKAEGKGAYEKGFLEGLLIARDDIIRRLHKGGMGEAELCARFELEPEAVKQILSL